ncbi:ABC transporter ATP-binding protein [Candidatus Methylopumilus planktonicus]|uniref:ABC transporter ATP-binding protein n=1 Tax=Candidatus Methylopumilus planktonicus TaxID=1581557 RepID=UPI003BEF4A7C
MKTFIQVKGVSVSFPVYDNAHRSLKKAVINLTTGGRIAEDVKHHRVVKALDSINFDLKDGSRLGLLGHNGSGKTTLLRVLSGVYTPTSGKIVTQGRIASLLDVSLGLDPDATGFENIYLRGVLEGLKPKDIKNKIDDIADFSELGDFLNFPVRTYSSGMMLRLAFAISTSIDAEILIMDEWLSVGDTSFNVKATKRLNALIKKASILVITSHDEGLINKICNRVIRLEHGHVVSDEKIKKTKAR